jgi:squalene-hopene/tetraprenyl-beta-curcumene cyclase
LDLGKKDGIYERVAMRHTCILRLALLILASVVAGISSADEAEPSAQDIQAVRGKALAFLKSHQGKDGSFAPRVAGPGVTALVVAALARNGVSTREPIQAGALDYLEKQIQKDGGIYSKFLANYTTSIALMAFKECNGAGKYDGVIGKAAEFLKDLQQDSDERDLRHGGFGYDAKSRPDLSNTAFSVEALLAAGVPRDDPAVRKALQFVSRCQNLAGEFNDQAFAKKATKDDEGGFVYHGFNMEERKDKTPEGGLRSLGGMTYGGLKSFLYAGVSKDDPRVQAAVRWIRRHYTLDENPGMGKAGLYYYYHTFAKAMDALGEETFTTADGQKHSWRRELFDALKKRQQDDGGWRNAGDKTFSESNPELATSFALLSLSYCNKKAH